MGLKKLISIRNIGRFRNYSASGEVECKRYTIIFAENGRGKSTLCAILRSLQSGDPAHIIGRTTLGSSAIPEVRVLADCGTVVFQDRTWTTTIPNIEIFDSYFVSENVYSGDVVSLEQRRNLYRVIVGQEGVVLARRIDELDDSIRAQNAVIREKSLAIQSFIPRSMTLDVFVKLPVNAEIDARIEEKEKEFEAVKQAELLKSRPGLARLVLPSLPGRLVFVLGKTVEGIATDAANLVAEQIRNHGMHEIGEEWLSSGLTYIRERACPFCNQGIENLALISAYKTFFSQAYKSLREEIEQLRSEVEIAFGERAIATVEKTQDQNANSVEYWGRYCQVMKPEIPNVEIGDTLRRVRDAALQLVNKKISAPLESLQVYPALEDALEKLKIIEDATAPYNFSVDAANLAIQARKKLVGTTDLVTVEKELLFSMATKRRHEEDARKACEEYALVLGDKVKLETDKFAVRKMLDEYTNTVAVKYENAINRLLEDFHTGFRITKTSHAYPGGVASSTYQISINDTAVGLGDFGTPLDVPSFKNTLSSGDKSTLALAIFIAQLEQNPDKADKIVVFDDPFTSQDAFRRDHTVSQIKKCGETCAQVLVLSHDQGFLKRVWDRFHSVERKALWMARVGLQDTAIAPWDVEEATQARFKADQKAMADYYNYCEGSPREIVQKVRPTLETFCRTLYPSHFSEGDNLGAIISKIRTFNGGHQLSAHLNMLEEVNEYTARYHHGDSPTAATEPIIDSELQGYVKETLGFVGCC